MWKWGKATLQAHEEVAPQNQVITYIVFVLSLTCY
jgi:hypothetical protein